MFVIAGITGNTGSAAAEALLGNGLEVRAIVRDRAKALSWARRGVELVTADLSDPAALERAFAGASGAYVLAPPDLAQPDPIGWAGSVARAVRDGARAAGLPRLVFLSSAGAHLPSGTGPIQGTHLAENVLAGAVPKLTFLRATYFQENLRPAFQMAGEQGVLPTFFADLDEPRPMVAATDIGRAAAALLTEANPPDVVELSGPREYSVRDMAAAAAAVVGRSVTPVQPPRDSWIGVLRQAGFGQAYAELLVEMNDGLNSGHVRFQGVPDQRRGAIELAENFSSWYRAQAA